MVEPHSSYPYRHIHVYVQQLGSHHANHVWVRGTEPLKPSQWKGHGARITDNTWRSVVNFLNAPSLHQRSCGGSSLGLSDCICQCRRHGCVGCCSSNTSKAVRDLELDAASTRTMAAIRCASADTGLTSERFVQALDSCRTQLLFYGGW